MITKQVNGQKQNEKRVKFVTNPTEKKEFLRGSIVRPWGNKILVDADYMHFGELGEESNSASQENVKV